MGHQVPGLTHRWCCQCHAAFVFGSTNLQKIRVKLLLFCKQWVKTSFVCYSNTVFWWVKIPFKLSNGLKSVTGKIPYRKQPFADGMQILNAVEQTPKTRSAQVVQLRWLRPKTQKKNPENHFVRSKSKVASYSYLNLKNQLNPTQWNQRKQTNPTQPNLNLTNQTNVTQTKQPTSNKPNQWKKNKPNLKRACKLKLADCFLVNSSYAKCKVTLFIEHLLISPILFEGSTWNNLGFIIKADFWCIVLILDFTG